MKSSTLSVKKTPIRKSLFFEYSVLVCSDIAGVVVYNQPFQLCVLPQFIISDKMDFLRQLTNEILRLKFVEKNNDLYQFRQVSPYV